MNEQPKRTTPVFPQYPPTNPGLQIASPKQTGWLMKVIKLHAKPPRQTIRTTKPKQWKKRHQYL